MAKTCNVYDGAAWRTVVPSIYDGATWRTAINGWVYDGAAWQKFYSTTHGAITSLVVTPSSASVATFGTQQFTATAYDIDSIPWDVTAITTWSVDTFTDSIDAAGLFTAGGSPGSPIVTGTYSGYPDTSPVTVS